MFIQQPFRVLVSPIEAQQQPTRLDSAIRMHYTAKAREFSSDVVRIHRVDVLNPVLVGDSTQAEVMISVEADTIAFFNHFVQSFFVEEETDTLSIKILR